MVFTITKKGYIYARPGKSVWQGADEARDILLQQDDPTEWTLGQIDADWEDCQVEAGEAFRSLPNQAVIHAIGGIAKGFGHGQ